MATSAPLTTIIPSNVAEHLASEEAFLDRLHAVLERLGAGQLFGGNGDHATTVETRVRLQEILHEAEQLHLARRQFAELDQSSVENDMPLRRSASLSSDHPADALDDVSLSRLSSRLHSIRKKISRIVGLASATVRTLQIEHQIVASTLLTLGVETFPQRYNSAGERVFSPHEFPVETHS